MDLQISKAAGLGNDKQFILDVVTEMHNNNAEFHSESIDGYMFSRSGIYLLHLLNCSSAGVRYARGLTVEIKIDDFEQPT